MYKLYFRAAACCVALGVALTGGAQAQRRAAAYFQDDATAGRSALGAALQHSRPLTLNVAGLRAALATAPAETQPGAAPLTLALPLPDGTTGRFAVTETAVMAPALAAQFPQIKTYRGVGLDEAAATVRLDMTPQGFHAQILSPTAGTIYIDPATRGDQQHVLSFFRRDMNRAAAGAVPVCQFQPTAAELAASQMRRIAAGGSQHRTLIATGPTLRTYRLAVAATGEYTTFHGGTVALAQAAIVTTVNRVVGVYEKELAVRLQLVGTNSQIIYTNTGSDPYTNGNPNAMIGEAQSNITTVIGTNNFDIGHVFGTNSGGLAGLGVVCNASNKARGVTGSSAPVADAFDIDYVAHEMGHQFGGNHTFNSATGPNCGANNGNPSTAFEPGSGSTIMAYAGICAPDNLQNNSDPYFHTGSFQEIATFIASTSCGTSTATGNTAPVVTIPASRTLPIGTPFRLTASATDANNDALTYCWEEMDLGPYATLTAAQAANSNVPLFRSFLPVSSPTRYFPRLSDIISNTSSTSERLPTVTRTLSFRCTARDQHSGPAGVIGGVNYSANLNLSVTSAAGPFLVTAPNTALTWTGGSTQTVTWIVAGTSANGVNCATVNILLSTDGGLTYPTALASGVANDGSQAVTVPSVATTTARIMVAAADNYFFDISNTNFTITAPAACNAPTDLSVGSVTQTTAAVSFTASASATGYTVTTTPASTTQTVAGGPVTLSGLTPGTAYTVSIVSNCAGGTTSTAATASFSTTAPPPCNAPTNLAASSITASSAVVSFTPNGTSSSYTVTTFPATTTQTVTASPVTLTGLTGATSYTVSIVGNCANGVTSAPGTLTFATRVPNDECATAINLASAVSCSTTTGTVTGATQSQAPSSCSGATSASALDVWYSFTATGPTHTVTTNSAFDGVLQVFSGSCGSLASLGCRDLNFSGGETLTVNGLTAGTRYYIRYYPYDTAPADGSFTICVTGAVAPTAAPVVLTPANGSLTNNNRPPVTGTAPTSTTVTVYVDGSSIGSTTADASGNWTLTPAASLADGSHTVYATAAVGGNVSANSNTNTFTVDTTPPAAPVVVVPANGSLTNNPTPLYGGSAEAGTTITVVVDGTPVGTATAVPGGTWGLAQPTALANGSHTVKARAADAAGNSSVDSNTNTFIVDTTAPTATLSSAAGASGGSTTTTPLPFAVTFSESVTGFAASGISVTNGTVTSGPTGSGSGPYTFAVTPTTAGTATTVQIGANAAQDAAGNGNAASASYSLTYLAPATATTWTGAANTDWYTAGNWTAGVPTALLDATVPASAPRMPLIGSGTATARGLSLNSGATLSQTGGTLDVRGNLTNNGTFQPSGGTVVLGTTTTANILGSSGTRFWNLTVGANGAQSSTSASTAVRGLLTLNGNFVTQGNPLTLVSDATATAMVVNTGSNVVTGNLTVQRYIVPALNPNRGYRHVSAPVGTATVSSLTTAGFSPVVNPAYNASATPATVSPFPTVFGYDQSRLATTSNNLSTFDKGWYSPSAGNDPLSVGQGYTVNLAADQTLSFTGPQNNGTVPLALSRNSGATAASAGLHLVGNPYPSPLDWSLVTAADRPNVDGVIYVFASNNPANPYTGSYGFYQGGFGNISPVLPLGQGFFVRVAAGQTAGTLTLRNSHRPTSYSNPTYQRTTETRPAAHLTLRPAGSPTGDDVFVYFEQGATDGFDARYDAEKLPNPSGLNLSTSLSATQRLCIDGRPPLGTSPLVVPLAVGVPAVGSYTLSAAELLNLAAVPTYLRDLQTGALIDLAQQPSYSFTVSNAAALITGRFELVFSPQRPLATAAAHTLQLSVWPNPVAGQAQLNLTLSKAAPAATATLRDVVGRTVATQAFSGAGTSLPTAGLAKGTYLLSVTVPGQATVTRRVVVE
ncbi:reprolysin-like metallopeptidase [Hymenobacter edaphi]|uniref:Fibronectin type-III domain-containing protein n=1 Tax=Hymenobacter edaphi TaxID=2211146 RepID=A0A328BHD2_9BACT|nr:zinc-dependent metalloprotease family protein [Hymenobacter edaphi]RAK65999.1 hypothetical protein DLM85_14940 [Hymenobacter edaphi]